LLRSCSACAAASTAAECARTGKLVCAGKALKRAMSLCASKRDKQACTSTIAA